MKYRNKNLTLFALSLMCINTALADGENITSKAGETQQPNTQSENSANIQTALGQQGDESTSGAAEQLEEMVVSATRSELSTTLTPGNPTVINEKNTQNRLNQRIGDALLEAPGVYMRGSAYGTAWPGSGAKP